MVLTQYQLKSQKRNSKHKKNIIVTSVYRPPNTNPKHFVSKVNNFLHQLHHENKHAFILGDYNINTIAAMVSPDNVVNDFSQYISLLLFSPVNYKNPHESLRISRHFWTTYTQISQILQ